VSDTKNNFSFAVNRNSGDGLLV